MQRGIYLNVILLSAFVLALGTNFRIKDWTLPCRLCKVICMTFLSFHVALISIKAMQLEGWSEHGMVHVQAYVHEDVFDYC